MNNIQKEARRDAREYARAQMYYGEGAGTRRKLITNSVAAKVERKSGYHEAFTQELARQDMAEHAAAARKERRRKDVSTSVEKNARGVISGNYQSVNAGLVVIGVLGYFAHKTGFDQKVYDAGKTRINSFRAKRAQRAHNITSL